MTTNEKRIIALTGCSHALAHMYMLIFPAALPLIEQEYGLGHFAAGLIGNVCYFLFGFGALPAGFLADRFGSKRLIGVYLLGAGGASLLIALAGSVYMFAVALGLLGIFAGLYHPSGLSLISRHTREQGKALGYHGMAGNVGLALAPFLAAGAAATLGWKATYALFALPGFATGLLLLLWKIDEDAPMTTAAVSDTETRLSSVPIVTLLLIYLIAALNGFCYRGALTFLPMHLAEQVQRDFLGLSYVAKGGAITTAALIVGVAGQFLGGHLSELMKRESLMAALVGCSVPFLFLMGLVYNAPLIAMTILFAFFHFSAQPVSNGLVADYTMVRRRSLGYGISFSLAFGLGSFASGFSGYVAENFGLGRVFTVLGFIAAATFLATLVLVRLRRNAAGQMT